MSWQWTWYSRDILKLALKVPSASSNPWKVELLTKSPEQHSECPALNHYRETAVNIWICQSNVSMAPSLCNMTKRFMWTYPKWRMHFVASLLHFLLNPNLLPVTWNILVHSFWGNKSKAYNKEDVVCFFKKNLLLFCWVFSFSWCQVIPSKGTKICKVKN